MYVTVFTKANIAMDDVLNRDLGFCALGLGEGVYFPECLEGLVKTNFELEVSSFKVGSALAQDTRGSTL